MGQQQGKFLQTQHWRLLGWESGVCLQRPRSLRGPQLPSPLHIASTPGNGSAVQRIPKLIEQLTFSVPPLFSNASKDSNMRPLSPSAAPTSSTAT